MNAASAAASRGVLNFSSDDLQGFVGDGSAV
jgi:hypothetical protein